MEKENLKTTKFFSWTLMKQSIKSNLTLMIAITVVMCLMTVVMNYASSLIGMASNDEEITEAQTDFYSHLYILASYNETAGTDLSYEDFIASDDKTMYETVFTYANSSSTELNLSTEAFEESIEILEDSDVSVDTYVREFEYVYALGNVQGCFSDEALSVDDMLLTMFEAMGISSDLLNTMSSMDTASMLNIMYYTVMGILPMLIFIVVAANSLIADQVDKGSMAYILSTPIERRAVSITQALYMVFAPLVMIAIVCCFRLGSSFIFFEEVEVLRTIVLFLGMYILIEAFAGICYLGSSFANTSGKSYGFGGGLTVWFFLASLISMFGMEDMVNAGMGVEELGNFGYTTIITLFDVSSISTIGTGSVDTTFVWKLAILAIIALACYVIGGMKFKKKDLPL